MLSTLNDPVATSEIDPFSSEFLADPYPNHEQLREAGPVVRLARYDAWAVFRYEQVHAVLNDWQTFSSGAGVGLANFHKEGNWRPLSLLLETDPPDHTRARTVMNRVLSPRNLRELRDGFYRDAVRMVDRALEFGSFRCGSRIDSALSIESVSGCRGPRRRRTRNATAIRQHGVQHHGAEKRFLSCRARAGQRGLALGDGPLRARSAKAGQPWRRGVQARGYRGRDRTGSRALGSVVSLRRHRHHDFCARQRAPLLCPESCRMAEATAGPCEGSSSI